MSHPLPARKILDFIDHFKQIMGQAVVANFALSALRRGHSAAASIGYAILRHPLWRGKICSCLSAA